MIIELAVGALWFDMNREKRRGEVQWRVGSRNRKGEIFAGTGDQELGKSAAGFFWKQREIESDEAEKRGEGGGRGIEVGTRGEEE